MDGHGQGHVAVPAVVAADLVVVQAALLLRCLEALLNRPPGTGDADQLVQGGLGRAVGDVVRDLVRPTDAAAGDHVVPSVLAVPGTDLDPGPVVDARAVGPIAAGTALPFLPRQPGKQVVDGMVHGPAGDDGVVPGGGHDVEDIRPLQLRAPAFGEAVGGVRGHPPERDLLRDGPADHGLGHHHLRLEADRVIDARGPTPVPIIRP